MFTINPGPEFLKTDIRANPELDSLGALGDTGWYCIRAILWANDYKFPNTVTAMPKPKFNSFGAILSCGATLNWDDGKIATFFCSFHVNITTNLTCGGTEGYLHMHDFVIPYQEHLAFFHVASKSEFSDMLLGYNRIPSERVAKTELPQEALMVQEFGRLVKGITKDGSGPKKKWGTISRKTQVVVDAVKASNKNGFQAVEIGY